MKKILYIIRTEADFERVVCIAITGKEKYEQHFVFAGDFSPFYEDGIQNIFQKELFSQHGFSANDFCNYNFISRSLKLLAGGRLISFQQLRERKSLIFRFAFNVLLRKHLKIKKSNIVKKITQLIAPDALLTDQSLTDPEYIPEIFRRTAIKAKIPVYIFTHGAAGGLHSFFSDQIFDDYRGYTVLACSESESKSKAKNRIILGDMSSSYPYVKFINQLELHDIHFLDERKYKVGFLVGGTGPFTSTTGWYTMEEIIIDLSENPDIAMVLKLHPREASFIDLRMLKKFDNLLIVERETDRSRVSKWADIVVCSDHCSTIFEPMSLGKKVVAIEGKHLPKYKSHHSPLKYSSVWHITSADEFDLDKIPNANPEDPVTNEVAWGGHGKVNLAKLALHHIQESL